MNEKQEITKRQIKTLQTLAHRIYNDEEERRDWLQENYGCRSFTQLNMIQADELIKVWSKALNSKSETYQKENGGIAPAVPSPEKIKTGGGIRRPYVGKGKKGEQKRITEPQAERIGLLAEILGWNMDSIHKFIYRQLCMNKGFVVFKTVEMLMNYEAVKVIIGMERIAAGNLKLEYGQVNEMENGRLRGLIKIMKADKPAAAMPRRDL